MKKLGFVLLLLALSSCGYDGSYRYSCQDPDNWGKKECTPPLCSADGNCTETLLGFDPTASTIEIVPDTTEGSNND
jgi:hypothetical protein